MHDDVLAVGAVAAQHQSCCRVIQVIFGWVLQGVEGDVVVHTRCPVNTFVGDGADLEEKALIRAQGDTRTHLSFQLSLRICHPNVADDAIGEPWNGFLDPTQSGKNGIGIEVSAGIYVNAGDSARA